MSSVSIKTKAKSQGSYIYAKGCVTPLCVWIWQAWWLDNARNDVLKHKALCEIKHEEFPETSAYSILKLFFALQGEQ